MDDRTVITALVLVVAILAIAYWAYDQCKLDHLLPPKHQRCGGRGSFVGAMAQHSWLVPCAFPTSSDWSFNRCNAM